MDKIKITEIMTSVDEMNSAVSQPLMPIANVFIKEEPIDDKETVFIDDKGNDDNDDVAFKGDDEDDDDEDDDEDEGETEYGINIWPVTVKLDMDGDDGLEGDDDDDDDDDDNDSFKDGNENSADNSNRNNNLVGRKRKKLLKMRKKKKLMLYSCKQCNVKFNTEMEFNMHTHTTHYSNVSPNFNSNKFTCLLCKKIFNNRTYLDAHVIRTHTEKKTINCIKCNKVFKYRSYLTSNKDNNTSKKTKSVTPKQNNENKQFTCFHCNLKRS